MIDKVLKISEDTCILYFLNTIGIVKDYRDF